MGCSSLVVQVVISPPVPLTIEETQRGHPLYNARVRAPCRNPQKHNRFNSTHMNQAVFAFRRYEDSSLSYTGIDSHPKLRHYGLYDTVVGLVRNSKPQY
ncbi:unannotated protein [freshwater metagenome]|uniref:Unannotated protein n=1 Tax=freshwater metagenome TaxID=449393 RepID=A0A6J7LJ22_9ZZZZ